jgi:glyoxylase-like metal-dependent hydrolase (beta-lactamase superfamily II)
LRFFAYYSLAGFSNSYLLGPEGGGDAVLIDPGIFDVALLNLVEGNKLYIRYVLVTHSHTSHVDGLRTILKIYQSSVFCRQPSLLDYPTTEVREGQGLELGEFRFKLFEVPGHSSDSMVFKLNDLLFTGDALMSGSIGSTADEFARAMLVAHIREKILTLDDNTLIFPGHGPPTKVSIERTHNPGLAGHHVDLENPSGSS